MTDTFWAERRERILEILTEQIDARFNIPELAREAAEAALLAIEADGGGITYPDPDPEPGVPPEG